MTAKFLSDAKTHFRFPSLLLGFLDDYLDPVKPLNPEETGFLPRECRVGEGPHKHVCFPRVFPE